MSVLDPDPVWESRSVPELARLLADLDPVTVPGADLMRALLACRRVASWVDAVEQTVLAALARPGVAVPIDRVVEAARWSAARPGDLAATDDALDTATDPVTDPRCSAAIAAHAARFASMEVGAALHLSPITARARVDRALLLVDRMPATLAAQRDGAIDPLRTSILADTITGLSGELGAAVERATLHRAATCTPGKFRALLTHTVITLDPDGATGRANCAKKTRDVYRQPQPDDMATVTAVLTADQAARMMWLLNTMADAANGPGDERDAGQRRADALRDIIDTLVTTGFIDIRPPTCTPGPAGPDDTADDAAPRTTSGRRAHAAPRVCLNVYLDATTLAGADDLPADLAGHGAITADLARGIAASADTVRAILVNRHGGQPASGALPSVPCQHAGCTGGRYCGTTLDHGREVYRPPAALDEHTRTRYPTCQFPGCRMPATRCDLDHEIPYHAGGPTCPCNLRPLCRTHHLAKTFTGWTSTTTPHGTTTWTSPLGYHYTDPPEHPIANRTRPPEARTAPDDDPPPF